MRRFRAGRAQSKRRLLGKRARRGAEKENEGSRMLKRPARRRSADFTGYHYRIFEHKREKTEWALERSLEQLGELGDYYNCIGKR